MVRSLVVALALVAVAGAPARADDQPSPQQKAALIAKASVVRVKGYWEVTLRVGKEYVGGTGSGFFVSADGFVVTNAHVVADIQGGEQRAIERAVIQLLTKAEKAGQLAGIARDQLALLVQQLKATATARPVAQIVLPDGTALDYVIKAYGKPGESDDVAVVKVELKDAPNLPLANTDKLQIQDKLLAIGYPGAADMEGTGLLDDKSQLEASINDGAITALKRSPSGDQIIQINAAITHGNSGGPAVNLAGEVIGLGTFGSQGEVQGFNFLVSASTVKRFVTRAKVDTKPSNTITLWKKALDEFWARDLDHAIEDFEEVAVLFPTHSEAPRLIRQARQLKKEGKGKPPPEDKAKNDAGAKDAGGGGSSGAGIAVAIVIVLVLVGGVTVVVLKMKKGPRPGMPVAGAMPPGARPPGMMPPGAMPPGAPPGPPPGPGAPYPPYASAMSPGQGVAPYGSPSPSASASAPMVAGRAGPAPVSKTVAIGQNQHAPVAATAFGSLTMGSLTCTRGQLMGQRFSLGPQGLLIGRQPGVAQIVVNDSRASGKHVWIGFENGTLVAIDQGTTNGTFVNDVRNGRISKVPLRDGDVVIVSEPDCLSLQLKLS